MNIKRVRQIIEQEMEEAKRRIVQQIEEEFNYRDKAHDNDEVDYSEGDTPLPDNENYEKTLKLLLEGKSQSEISRILGVTIQSTRRYINWLVRNGHYENNQSTELTDREERLVELVYKESKSFSEAATTMECSVENIKTMHDNLSAKAYLTDPFIKILYPDFFKYLDNPRIGFPQNRYKLASQVRPGQLCYVYLTTPCKKIVALVKIVSEMIITTGRWPYVFEVEIVIPPKKGVSISEVGINKRLRPGDTHICISNQVNTDLMNKLQAQPDLTEQEIKEFIDNVDNYFRRQMHQN